MRNKIKIQIIFSLILCFGIFGMAENSKAADYYVSNAGLGGNGSTSNPWGISEIPWTNFEAGAENTNIYFFGGTYAQTLSIRHKSTSNTLSLKPCSASAQCPSGENSQVVFSSANGGNIIFDGSSDNITINGETTSGSGTRNIKVIPGNGHGIDLGWAANPTRTNFKIKYIELTGLDSGTVKEFGGSISSIYGINFSQVGAGTEIAHNYIHDNWGHTDVLINTGKTGYGIASVHDNIFERGTTNYIFGGSGVDIHNNIFNAADAIYPYDIIHNYSATGISYMRVYNNHFDSDDQMIFLEAATSTECAGTVCPTQHIRIYNNVFTCTSPSIYGNVNFGGRPIIIENAHYSGSQVDGFVNDFYIVNNTFVNNQYAFNMAGGSGDVTDTYTNFKFINNICYENSSNVMYNNAATCAGYQGNVTWTSEANAVFDHNLLFDDDILKTYWLNAPNGAWATYNSPSVFTADWMNYSHNITESDVFAETTNYTIDSSSKVIDKGQNLSALTNMGIEWPKDKAGNSRDGVWDMGAYEYQSGDTTPPSVPSGLVVN